MAHENRHQFCRHDFAEKAQFLRNFREGFRGRWLVSGNRGQRAESGKVLTGAKAVAACAKGNPKFATQHARGSGDATLARLFGRGNSARDEHLGWRCQGAALSRQEGPAQSSEPEKHRGQQVQSTTNNNEIANGRRLRWIADSRSGCSRYHWVPARWAGCSVWRAGFSSCPSWRFSATLTFTQRLAPALCL